MISSVVLFSLVVFVDSVSGQQFESGTEFYRRQFTNITIPWIFTYNGGSFITTWKYMGTNPEIVIYRLTDKGLPLNDPIPRNQFSGRVNFIGDVIRTGSKDATLSIRDFTKQDEGDFECSIQGALSIAHKVTIIAIVLSNVTDFRVINVAQNDVVQGTEVTLSCTATVGKPSSNIELLKGTNVLNSSMTSATSSMTVFYNFKNITKEDSGEYICEVKTTNGYVSRKVLQLSVKYPPEIAKSVTTEQFGCLKTSISLGCEASGNPKPKIRITGPNKESLNNEFILQRFGVYICEANNTLGSDKRNISVSLAEDKPGEPVFSQCAFDKLTWLPSISKTSVKYTLQAKEVSGIWFDILTSSDTMYSPSTNETLSNSKDYEFRVVASNCVGSTESKICSVTDVLMSMEDQNVTGYVQDLTWSDREDGRGNMHDNMERMTSRLQI
ncbi:cell adhesion molecule 2-like isoform X2 [Xenia sp. Carnegie-2017]|uniref:cell adhesion molecule 2-like isoform X2 n=1 Tax=Xenia sp. Carnegie-2017 TaxID=2897299 RepID=UPI001F0451AF|nr:cell adhesion molecule 2-like isoform X2 [Xenia sp. Carnegie-2017]